MQSFIASLSYYKSDVFVIHAHLRTREDRKFSYTKQNIFNKSSVKVETKSVVKEIVMSVCSETTCNAKDYLFFRPIIPVKPYCRPTAIVAL